MIPLLQTAPVVVENPLVRLSIERLTGSCEVKWRDGATMGGIVGEVRFADGRVLHTYDHRGLGIKSREVRDGFGKGTEVAVTHSAEGQPTLRHLFWVYKDRPEVFARLEVVGSPVGSNYLAPVVARSFRIPKGEAAQSLYVPYDNDGYSKYRSDNWGEKAESYEVGAAYNDENRSGLVVGSVDHDLWKSAVKFRKSGEVVAYAGASSDQTRDKAPHGTVTGPLIQSPRMMLGAYADWRTGMERYGDANSVIKPALPWKGAVPFGWNSWGGYKDKITAKDADACTDVIADDLPKFRNGGTAYVNFDSFWDNLKPEQRVAFVRRAHSKGLKAGIYYTPFTYWGEPDWKADGTETRAAEIMVKGPDGKPLPKFSGGYALDPTHPFVQARIRRQMEEFVRMGFDFVKLDFLTHGAVEGGHHDPKIQTGTAAYIVGMKDLLSTVDPKKIGRPFFVSLSIAPLFPHGYGHSRRVSCDVFSNIGASEYLLNSSNYGWWTNDRLYRFNDPDHTVVYQALGEDPSTEAEARTRFTASVVTGGMLLDGDALSDPKAKARALPLYRNQAVVNLAKKAHAFRPVHGDTGEGSGEAFFHIERDGKTAYVAVFNFDRQNAATKTVPLALLGLTGGWEQTDLWDSGQEGVADVLTLVVPARGCRLVRLTRSR